MDVVESLSVEQFAITCSARATQLAWLVGAGISAAGGISTGYDMILDFKTRLFCAQMGLSRREIDSGDPLWNQRICGHFDGRDGMPPNGHPDEYSSYFARVFPDRADRRTYIEHAIRQGIPSFGHRALASAVASGSVPAVFTTNFDQLIETSCTEADGLLAPDQQVRLAVADLNRVDVAERCLRENSWPLLALIIHESA